MLRRLAQLGDDLHRMAERFAPARAVQIVGELRQPAQHGRVEVASADGWLAGLAA